jgi:hypothetical protein
LDDTLKAAEFIGNRQAATVSENTERVAKNSGEFLQILLSFAFVDSAAEPMASCPVWNLILAELI